MMGFPLYLSSPILVIMSYNDAKLSSSPRASPRKIDLTPSIKKALLHVFNDENFKANGQITKDGKYFTVSCMGAFPYTSEDGHGRSSIILFDTKEEAIQYALGSDPFMHAQFGHGGFHPKEGMVFDIFSLSISNNKAIDVDWSDAFNA
jgi:hypothetical protein